MSSEKNQSLMVVIKKGRKEYTFYDVRNVRVSDTNPKNVWLYFMNDKQPMPCGYIENAKIMNVFTCEFGADMIDEEALKVLH